jgi:cytochrome c5
VSKADDIFYREFGVVLLLLTLFTICMIILAGSIGANAFEAMQNSKSAIGERIAPVGQVRVGNPDQVVAAEASESMQVAAAAPAGEGSAPAAGGSAKSGEAVYNAACLACHTTGAAGAPKLGDKAAWEPRFAQGLDALITNAINGKGAMPPKGGNPSWSDEEIRNAVEFMLEKAGLSG